MRLAMAFVALASLFLGLQTEHLVAGLVGVFLIAIAGEWLDGRETRR